MVVRLDRAKQSSGRGTVSPCCPIVRLTRLISLSLDDVYRPTSFAIFRHPGEWWPVLPAASVPLIFSANADHRGTI
jgi:hypothetical protein